MNSVDRVLKRSVFYFTKHEKMFSDNSIENCNNSYKKTMYVNNDERQR